MSEKRKHPLDKMISNEVPLKPEEQQILMEALEAAALTVSDRSTEKAHEAKSTRH